MAELQFLIEQQEEENRNRPPDVCFTPKQVSVSHLIMTHWSDVELCDYDFHILHNDMYFLTDVRC